MNLDRHDMKLILSCCTIFVVGMAVLSYLFGIEDG